MSRLSRELVRVLGDPPVAPRAVVRVQVGSGQGLQAGRDEADRLVDAGAELVVVDAELPGVAAAAAVAALLELEAVQVAGDRTLPEWRDRVVALRSAIRTARAHLVDTSELVAALDDPGFARAVGLLAQLSARRTPALLGGGEVTAAAALLASRLTPGAERWWLAGSSPVTEPGRRALQATGLLPLLDLELTEGSADIAVAVVRAGLEQLGA